MKRHLPAPLRCTLTCCIGLCVGAALFPAPAWADDDPTDISFLDETNTNEEQGETPPSSESEEDTASETTSASELKLLSPTKDDEVRYAAMLAEAVKEKDFLSLRDKLKAELDAAYPQLLTETDSTDAPPAADSNEAADAAADETADEEADSPKPKKKDKKGKKGKKTKKGGKKGKKSASDAEHAAAKDNGPRLPILDKKASPLAKSVYSVYLCLDMALMNSPAADTATEDAATDGDEAGTAEAATTNPQDAFCAWLVSAKGKPALAFMQSLRKHKVTSRQEASELLCQLRDLHAAEPKKAYKEIPAIVNPVAGKVSKKLYPKPDKKKIGEEIAKILKRKGKGSSKDEQAAVNKLNVYRYLCGVTPNVVHSEEYGEQARKAATACHNNNGLSHALGDFTEICNLAGGSEAAPTVCTYMDDFGDTNRARRGHRMWCLHPQLGKCGFGVHEHYTAMRVTDTSNPKATTTAYSYPGRGYYPAEYMHGDGWSYFAPSGTELGSEVKVEMWKLSGSLKARPKEAQLSASNAVTIKEIFPNGHYVNFEPDGSVLKKKAKVKGEETEIFSGTYWIRITGSTGKVVDEYVVEFY